MKKLSCRLVFNTPAFLGDAEQNGAWRTPPIKALLRQFWRMDYARRSGWSVDISRMRAAEGALFGQAGDKGNSNQSQVRIRLDDWSQGKVKTAPDVGGVVMGRNRIPAALYAGYGPIAPGPRLKGNAAIQSGEDALLRLAFPSGQGIEQALFLADRYGALGGRSRNGWGSFALAGELEETAIPVREWTDAMQWDWPHAIGQDGNGALVWQSAPQARWEDAMQLLAQTRADVRRAVPDRLTLAYPDTRGRMPGWTAKDRVPNSLRFKVRKDGDRFVATVFHVPCRPADALWNELSADKQRTFITCFKAAHAFMDHQQAFKRTEA